MSQASDETTSDVTTKRLGARTTTASAAGFAEMAAAIHNEDTVEQTVELILRFALTALQCGYAGVSLRRGRGIETIASTDELVAGLDELQLELDEGPDIDLISDRVGVLVTDIRHESRWPRWSSRVAKAGIRSMLGARLYTDKETVGTLNLYDPSPNRFDLEDQAVAQIFARHAAIALSQAQETANLWHAIDARKRIGQAQGILMERYDLSEDQAFQVLLRYSQSNNIKLRLVAEQLITTRDLPGGSPAQV
ncbi:MAG: GAF and ANTAR domain-containing protein [Nocardioides sp.]|uniref:GAF and ANTAR domain-containing protein n=1 Tax=Nocardioides sp. TaxID=35761 RepID=UPI0039E5FD89